MIEIKLLSLPANSINDLLEMKNSVNFASQMNPVMRDYQLHLNDDVANKAEKLFGSEESFKIWLQKKIEQWLDIASARTMAHHEGLSDEALAEIVKDFPPLTQDAFPELSKSDFIDMVRSQNGRLPKGLEKWL